MTVIDVINVFIQKKPWLYILVACSTSIGNADGMITLADASEGNPVDTTVAITDICSVGLFVELAGS